MGNLTRFKGVEIVVRTRDEHCEPHVHAFHTGQKWELRIFFSFITTGISHVDLYKGEAPKAQVIQDCMDAVIDQLDRARELFWDATRTVCLNNKFVSVVSGEIQPASSISPGAIRIRTAVYNSAQKTIEITMQGNSQKIVAKCP